MTKTKKIWLGVLTFLPIIAMILYFIVFFMFFLGMNEITATGTLPAEGNMNGFFGSFALLFVLIIVAAIGGIATMVYYLVHAVKNTDFKDNDRLVWILILVLASGIGSIIYYFVIVLPLKPKDENLIDQ